MKIERGLERQTTVYVAGINCQAMPLARCLALMNPGVRVSHLASSDLDTVPSERDIVVLQRTPDGPAALPARAATVVTFPMIYFNAYHPDLVRVHGPEGVVRTPLFACNSSLALFGWCRGLSRAQTVRLF